MNLQGRGRLFVLSGPSGAGKGTLRKKAFESLEGIVFSISCTTRPVREGERDGVDYRFISEDAFRDLLGRGKFLEHAFVHGHYYGTLRSELGRIAGQKKIPLFDVDVQGGVNLKKIFGEKALAIFIMPPSVKELRSRLIKRGTDAAEKMV